MKFKALLLLVGTLSGSAAPAEDDALARDAYFEALTAMSPEFAAYALALEQHLTARCGRPQSLTHLQAVFRREDAGVLFVLLARKAGDTSPAKTLLARLPCEP